MIGMAAVHDNYPLYFEATNEKGLSMAGLNFPKNAVYFDPMPNKENVPSFGFIPWVLGQCACLSEVRHLLYNLNLTNENFSDKI
jgi:choloylglycine hydrolase